MGGHGSFAVDPLRLGLAQRAGQPLPRALLAKMESAFGADFSKVRVHVGPQAPRIGATAFTMGADIYFAPGQYQPDTVRGQQLLGHELAHVIQQRAGRVRNPFGTGLAVVRDTALEAEADRLGHRAAAHRLVVQRKAATIQRASSSSSWSLFGSNEPESVMSALRNRGSLAVGEDPLHGSFNAANLTGDLHVQSADPNSDVNVKFRRALKKFKRYIEVAADASGQRRDAGVIVFRPTGGVVVKQMIELLAFVGIGFMGRYHLKAKLDELKKHRNLRMAEIRAQIDRLYAERARAMGADDSLILSLIAKHPRVAHAPSPGMEKLIAHATSSRDAYDANNFKAKVRNLEASLGSRTGHAMSSLFFDEHLYLLQQMIGRGRPGYFTVSSDGIANDLDAGDPDAQAINDDINILLSNSANGAKGRKLYANRLFDGRASLRVRIFYGAIDDVLSVMPG